MSNIKITPEKKAAVWAYWDTPFSERPHKVPFRKGLRIGATTFKDLKREYDNEKEYRLIKHTDVMVKMINDKQTSIGNSGEITDDEVLALKRRNYEVAMSPNATKPDRELASKALGLLIDKQEITHHLSPELIEQSRKRADEDINTIEGEFKELSDRPPELEDV